MEYMSQEGFDKLTAELNELIKVQLPDSIKAISSARDMGDLSENFEYHSAKRRQGQLLGRIKFLQKVLANTRVLPVKASDSVQLLAKVELLNLKTGKKMSYMIASPHEANVKEGKISIKSPLALALLNKKQGEEVKVKVPAGILDLRIEKISY